MGWRTAVLRIQKTVASTDTGVVSSTPSMNCLTNEIRKQLSPESARAVGATSNSIWPLSLVMLQLRTGPVSVSHALFVATPVVREFVIR